MATPEVQGNSAANAGAAASTPDGQGATNIGRSFRLGEFERLETVFRILAALAVAGALLAYLGSLIGNGAMVFAGVLVFSATLVGMASLFLPLNWVIGREILTWWRRRADKRAGKVQHQAMD